MQDAIDAEPDPELLFVRLDVDVAGAALNGGRQDGVDQPHDRRLPARFVPRAQVDLLLVAGVREVVRAAGQLVELPHRNIEGPLASSRLGCARATVVIPRDGLADRGLRRDQRLDGAARPEPDVIEHGDVARIRHRNRQRRAGAPQRYDPVLAGRLGRYELQNAGLDFEPGQIDRSHAVLRPAQRRDLVGRNEPQVGQGTAEVAAVGLLVRQCFLELCRRDAPVLDQQFT